MLSDHEQGLADLLARAWTGPFYHSYQMPARRGSSAKWVDWHLRHTGQDSNSEWLCSSLANAAGQYAWDEIILSARTDGGVFPSWTSNECRQVLTSPHVDIEAFHLACIHTLQWGKVGRKRNGKDNASIVWLKRARENESLIQDVLRAVELLNEREDPRSKFGADLPMNSAMTKVYAFADPARRLVIYDGRVGAALALFAMEYWHPKPEQLPAELRFAYFDSQTPGKRGSRCPNVGRYQFPMLGRNDVHAKWMWSASRLLKDAAARAGCNVLQLERALFMVGYDISRAKIRYSP
jgi:hypothetical protein